MVFRDGGIDAGTVRPCLENEKFVGVVGLGYVDRSW